MLPTIMFYIFSGLLLLCALLVVSLRNTVHAVFFLILAFVSAAGLFVLAGCEFLAMILIIVYVGAVAVLFLFVVMMLGIHFASLKEKSKSYFWIAGGVGIFLGIQLITAVQGWTSFPEAFHRVSLPFVSGITNAHALGNVLYTTYALPFQVAGLILLIAMIGAITLTLRVREDVKRQKIRQQLEKRGDESITLVQAPLGKGL